MDPISLSKYSDPSYIVIGLNLAKNHSFILVNNSLPIEIKQIFDTFDESDEFFMEQANDEKIILITNHDLTDAQLRKLESYPQVHAIYSFMKISQLNEELTCLYIKSTKCNYGKFCIKILKKLWFILSLLGILFFAHRFPNLAASDGPLYAEYTIKWGCVIIIFFLNGLSLSTHNLVHQITRVRLHCLIQISSLLIFPCTIYGITILLAKTSINIYLINGILFMACTSTAISTSVIMTKNARGNDILSLMNGLLGNILGIFVSPALIYLFLKNSPTVGAIKEHYDLSGYLQVIRKLSLSVLLPLLVGQIINRIWTEKVLQIKMKLHFTEINSVALLILLWSVLCNLFQSGLLSTIRSFDLIAVIVLNAVFYVSFSILALFIARPPDPLTCRNQIHREQTSVLQYRPKQSTCIERWQFSREDTIAFMFCCLTKTLAQGIPLITAAFANTNQGVIGLLTIPLILYFVEQLMFGSIQVLLLQRWVKRFQTDNNTQLLQQNHISADIIINES